MIFSTKAPRKLGSKKYMSETALAYLLLTPVIVFLLLFLLYPIIYVFGMSLSKTDKLGGIKEFAGLKYYIEVLKQKSTWTIVGRTVLWTFSAVTIKTFFGIIIALLLQRQFFGRKAARMLFIVPWACSVPISVMLWKWVYHHEFGLLNHLLKTLQISNPPVWLGSPTMAFISNIWVDSWIGIPFMALMFLAAMQAIPKSQYEAADIDGANKTQKFFTITLPGMRDILLIATLLSCLWTFNDFNTPYILTKGGPAGTTDILITHVYKSGFEYHKWSKAAVLSIITFIILSILSVVYAKIYFKKDEDLK